MQADVCRAGQSPQTNPVRQLAYHRAFSFAVHIDVINISQILTQADIVSCAKRNVPPGTLR